MTTQLERDSTATLLLPVGQRALPPVAARRIARTLLVYSVFWLVGLLPTLFGAGTGLVAGGLGLALPGGGLLYGGHPVLAVTALVAFVLSVTIWWSTGPTVLPPIVWIASAALGAFLADGGRTWGQVVALALVPGAVALLLAVHLARHGGQVRRGAEINERLRQVDFVITGRPALDLRTPVVESTPEDLAHLRYALDLALQPIESFDGFTRIDQFREAATRYQLNALSYSLSMAQFTRTPAFSGYLAEAQRNAIEKMLLRRVWGYWALENAWGNLDFDRDPVGCSENIMLTGFHGLMVGMYESLNDDRYSQPGALSYRWSDEVAYANDFHTLAASIHRNMRGSAFTLFPCEPNWVYTVCNTFGMNTMISHDRLHGTEYFTELEPRLRHAYETEFLRPDGRIIGVRSTHLGLSWNFWSGPSIQMTTAFWMHAALPEIAQRTWWLLRESALDRREDKVSVAMAASARLDPGNYTIGKDTYGQIVTIMAATEMGDHEWAAAALHTLTERETMAEADGARRYADASGLANLYANVGRFGRYSALRDLINFGTPQAWREGPVLAEAAYPQVLVAKAVTDGHALDLVLRPGGEPSRTVLAIERLQPGRTYNVDGGGEPTLTADSSGHALLPIDLSDRLDIRIY